MVYHCAQAGRAQGREGGAANARVELHRVFLLVRHARESGFQLRLRLKVDCLLDGLLHKFLGGLDGIHADGKDRHLGSGRIKDRQRRYGLGIVELLLRRKEVAHDPSVPMIRVCP